MQREEIEERLDAQSEAARLRAIARSRKAIDYHRARLEMLEGMTAWEYDEYANFDPYAEDRGAK